MTSLQVSCDLPPPPLIKNPGFVYAIVALYFSTRIPDNIKSLRRIISVMFSQIIKTTHLKALGPITRTVMMQTFIKMDTRQMTEIVISKTAISSFLGRVATWNISRRVKQNDFFWCWKTYYYNTLH